MQGLLGTSGRRGGVNVAAAGIEQARIAAIESGTNAHIGFPISAANKTNAYSHFIVFRDGLSGERDVVALSRWQRLPTGVFFADDGPGFQAVATNRTGLADLLPRLGTENLGDVRVLTFNRFGQLQTANQTVALRVGEKPEPQGAWLRSESNYYEIIVQPLTGRAVVQDRSGK